MGVLQDKVALVTGGTIAQIGSGATGIVSDVSDFAAIDTVVAALESNGRGLDILFANAGGGEFASLADITVEHYLDTFNRNVGGTLFTVQKLLPLLNRGGSIILSGSTSTFKGMPAFGVYAASKAAVRSLGRTMAAELADRDVRVNTLIPGPVETPGLTGLAPAGGEAELLKQMADGLVMKRVGDPAEIAAAVVFLASESSSFMTGGELVVDGGETQV